MSSESSEACRVASVESKGEVRRMGTRIEARWERVQCEEVLEGGRSDDELM